jgi:hypothetical protein
LRPGPPAALVSADRLTFGRRDRFITTGGFTMRGNRAQARSFHPQLEPLEAREVPSVMGGLSYGAGGGGGKGAHAAQTATTSSSDDSDDDENATTTTTKTHKSSSSPLLGIGLTTLTGPVQSGVNDMNSLLTKLRTDQQTLTNDINAGATSQTIAADYSAASSVFGQIKADQRQISAQASTDQTFILLALASSKGNKITLGLGFFTLQNLSTLNASASNTLSTATGVANTAEPGGFPTIAQNS